MNGITNATTRRIAGPALATLLALTATAMPAQAATPVTTSPVTTPDATAGVTWSQLMQRKLGLTAESARLAALLPGLRTAATTRTADLTRAQQSQTAAATTLATAVTADQAARAAHAKARAAVVTAKKALAAAQKQRPRTKSRVTKATQVVTAAVATVQTRTVTVRQAASALTTAQTGYITATDQVSTAATAYRTTTQTIGTTQQRIASIPALSTSLAARAVALRPQVVVETRAAFTTTQTTQVYGVTVHRIVAYPFQRMIDDAAKAGVQLSGGGFRTRQQQIALRTTNGCPDIWTAPASSCRVPTAIPGRSLHELGLAIDMTSGKKGITDRTGPAFKWLAANAATYGFVNLPAEPWHWSITGG
ncbi:M15 family metallopeptidase [Micromonosporaceae bacterium Da 78-11]